jgi:hypothetical protein
MRRAHNWFTWHDHIKGVFSAAAVGLRIRQHRDQLDEPIERIGITVSEDQGKWCRTFAARVNEVNSRTVHCGLEMLELIQPALLLAPVETLLPVPHQLP